MSEDLSAHRWPSQADPFQLLEQLIGSQSLGATVERFVLLRSFNLLGTVVVLLWFLSPLGSQMSLRLLMTTNTELVSQAQVHYFNVITSSQDASGSVFRKGSILDYHHRPDPGLVSADDLALSALVSASMLASGDILKSPVDQWNNVKVPRLDEMAFSAGASSNPWVPIQNGSVETWASLSGLTSMFLVMISPIQN